MCRFVYYQGLPLRLSALITEPENSLINQSFHARELQSPLNGDGFGLAWFPTDGSAPALYRSIQPAWNNQNLKELCRVIAAERILGHVRAATKGSRVSEENSHPFRIGNMVFMHNGKLDGFPGFRRKLLNSLSDEIFGSIIGGTDSEHLFAVIVDEYKKMGGDEKGIFRMANAVESGIRRVIEWRTGEDQHFYINAVITDGEDAVACRFTTDREREAPSLHLHRGKRYHCVDACSRLLECESAHTSVVVSSEPLTEDSEWASVPPGEMVLIDKDQRIETLRLSL